MPTVSLDSVVTGDASPDEAPYRISANPGFDTATVTFTVAADTGPIVARRVTFNGNRKDGRLVDGLGVVCGLDVCGAPGSMLLAEEPGQHEALITYDELGSPPGGSYPVEITALSEAEGWA